MYKVQCGGVCKSINFEKRANYLIGYLNPESLNGSPTDPETDFK
jgi:hypothetical protein